MFAESTVYFLCALTSLACALLLLRAYLKNKVRLLLWSGLCFAGLALNNFILFADLIIIPQIDISKYRSLPGLGAVIILLYGLIWEVE